MVKDFVEAAPVIFSPCSKERSIQITNIFFLIIEFSQIPIYQFQRLKQAFYDNQITIAILRKKSLDSTYFQKMCYEQKSNSEDALAQARFQYLMYAVRANPKAIQILRQA